ncbi:hypothetical protein MKX01_005594 [Papaver californicum]|nr:hypothetical protein MKX01_005594 [Papaver californicum]
MSRATHKASQSYQMQRTSVDATNNERRAGTSSGNKQISTTTQSFELRRSPRFLSLEKHLTKKSAKGKSVTKIENVQIFEERHIAYNRSIRRIQNAVGNDQEAVPYK